MLNINYMEVVFIEMKEPSNKRSHWITAFPISNYCLCFVLTLCFCLLHNKNILDKQMPCDSVGTRYSALGTRQSAHCILHFFKIEIKTINCLAYLDAVNYFYFYLFVSMRDKRQTKAKIVCARRLHWLRWMLTRKSPLCHIPYCLTLPTR